MAGKRTSASIAITTLMAGVLALPGIVKMPSALADDPRDGIKSAVVDARLGSPCPPLNYSPALERDAQYAGRVLDPHDNFSDVGGYGGNVEGAIGTGDPARVAIDQAMDSARDRIHDCSVTDYGVDFQRFNDTGIFRGSILDGSSDAVVIVTGIAPPPPPPPSSTPAPRPPGVLPGGLLPGGVLTAPPLHIPPGTPEPVVSPPPPTNPPPPPHPPTPTATVTSDVDLYDVPGGNGNIIGMLRQGQVVKAVKACPSDNWCDLTDPKGSAWGSFLHNN